MLSPSAVSVAKADLSSKLPLVQPLSIGITIAAYSVQHVGKNNKREIYSEVPAPCFKQVATLAIWASYA